MALAHRDYYEGEEGDEE
jgi:hypothetical protein